MKLEMPFKTATSRSCRAAVTTTTRRRGLPADAARPRHHGVGRAADLVGTPSEVFTDANITNPANGYVLSLGGIGTESYLAGETIDAALGNVDVPWNETWRLERRRALGGFRAGFRADRPVRVRHRRRHHPGAGRGHQNQAVAEDDYYPAAALTWMPGELWADQFQLRFGWSETTARPDLREISDATFIDPLTEARVRGNPELVSSDLTNLTCVASGSSAAATT